MKKLLFIIILVAVSLHMSKAQCSNKGTRYPASAVCVGITTAGVNGGCNYAGEYAPFSNLISGQTYIAETCGDPDFDTYLTVFEGGTSTVLGFNDDACGVQSSVTFTAPASGLVDVGLREYQNSKNCNECGWSCVWNGDDDGCGFCVWPWEPQANSCNWTCASTNTTCMTITVRKASTQTTPSPTGPSSGCPNVVLNRPNPPTNLTYYWQTSATGTSTLNSSASYSVTADGTYYLRARDNCGNWATISTGKAVDITDATFYQDADVDGFGNPSVTVVACSAPPGYVGNGADCDDADANEYPSQNWYEDTDNDGYSSGSVIIQCLRPTGHKTAGELTNVLTADCDDTNFGINPGVSESPCKNGIDEDCNTVDGVAPMVITPNSGAVGACVSSGLGIWVDVMDASNRVIGSVHDNGHDIGTITISTLGIGNATLSQVCNGGLGSMMGRSFSVTTSNTAWQSGGNTVRLRFYFTPAEVASLIAAAGCGDNNGCEDDDDVCGLSSINTTKYSTGTGPGGVGNFIAQSGNGNAYGGHYIEFEVGSFSDFYLHGSEHNVPLPVEWLSFSARAVGGVIRIDWRTATEINNRGFEIERSKTSSTEGFEVIGWVDGNGNTTEVKMYNYLDENLVAGTYYYRLRQVDFDGQFEYSDVRSVTVNPKGFLIGNLNPNPASEEVTLTINVEENADAIIEFYNLWGQLVLTKKHKLSAGRNQINAELSNFKAGVYNCVVSVNNKSVTKKLVVNK